MKKYSVNCGRESDMNDNYVVVYSEEGRKELPERAASAEGQRIADPETEEGQSVCRACTASET